MALKKRNGIWHIDFFTPNGERIRRTAGTENKQQAQELHDKLKAEAWRVAQLGDKPKYTWKDAVVKWLTDMSHKKSIQTDKEILRYLNQYLQDKQLDDINKSCISVIKAHKLSTGASNATVNRMLALIRAILNAAAKDWEWLDDAPRIKMMPVVKSRIRWITKQEANRLFNELPEHLEAMARFSLATGLRESNVTGLEWSQIDMSRRCAWIYADQAKAGKSISVPLNEDAMNVLRKQMGKHKTHVFSYKGNPIGIANTKAWRNALKRAGISDFRWHDLRHTWASWHVQNGTPLHVLKELGGWADLTMVLRYAHLSSDHLNGYAANIENRKFDTNSTQTQKSPEGENRRRA